jgi:hypothetical protein
MTPTYTLTLRNATSSIQAVIRYPTGASAYPKKPKDFTAHKLYDGSRAYDYPANPIKRRWELDIVAEDTSDALLTNLNALFALTEALKLDEDALIVESGINVVFESFEAIYQVGTIYNYRIVLQEI